MGKNNNNNNNSNSKFKTVYFGKELNLVANLLKK